MGGMDMGSGMSMKGHSKGCNGVVYSCSIICMHVFRVLLVIQSLQEGECVCD